MSSGFGPWEPICRDPNLKVQHRISGLAVRPKVEEGDSEQIYVVTSDSNAVLELNPSPTAQPRLDKGRIVTTGYPSGSPVSLAFDSSGALFVADFAHKSILSQPPSEGDVQDGDFAVLVSDYEGKPLLGPNSLCFDSNGTLFFTDSGPMGETSLGSPKGSVFCVSTEDQLLKPLALECLAHPAGIAASKDGCTVYVAETMANRILRFIKGKTGVFLCSVFYQFSGGFGPTSLAVDAAGNLFVGRYDFATTGEEKGSEGVARGKVIVISSEGDKMGECYLPGPEVSSLIVTEDENGVPCVWIIEQSSCEIFKLSVSELIEPRDA